VKPSKVNMTNSPGQTVDAEKDTRELANAAEGASALAATMAVVAPATARDRSFMA
jgi:hypothetical protein